MNLSESDPDYDSKISWCEPITNLISLTDSIKGCWCESIRICIVDRFDIKGAGVNLTSVSLTDSISKTAGVNLSESSWCDLMQIC